MAASGTSSSTTLYNLMLGIFLKLLGFFVILYIYADIDPIKARQTEESIREQFNISVSLVPKTKGIVPEAQSDEEHNIVSEMAGRSLMAMETALKGQISFLSTSYVADDNILVLRLPAEVALTIGSKLASSPTFASTLSETLRKERNQAFEYHVDMIVTGHDTDALQRAISLFVQQMAAQSYPQNLMAIGYRHQDAGRNMLEIRIHALPAKTSQIQNSEAL